MLGVLFIKFFCSVITYQNVSVDTIYVVCHRNKICLDNLKVVSISGNKYYTAKKYDNDLSAANSFDAKMSEHPYIIFINYNGNIIEEGFWEVESINGYYKRYYTSGKIKEQGVYYFGNKIGVWKYYNKKGEILKLETHPDKYNVLGTQSKYPKL